MSTTRLLSLFLFLLPSAVRAEPFFVWEQDRQIWSRDEATGEEKQVSRSDNAWSPDWDGNFAVWIADWAYPSNVMGSWLDDHWHHPFPHNALHVSQAVASDPRVSAVEGNPWVRHFVVWREDDSLWALSLGHQQPTGQQVVSDYTGPFDLDGGTLTWEGGTMDLPWFDPEAIPEPGTAVMLLIGLVCCGWHLSCCRVRSSGS